MSFLNPVDEPVLRFSSTDADAPQIDYNTRVAGDVKAVLKACLVDGYGTTVSAGWSAVNEVGNVIEFVSPSAAMSDYRLGVDDTSATEFTWYYQHQDFRVNPSLNSPTKNHTNINLTSASNGWQLLVTEQGIIFIEILDDTIALGLVTRVMYWGRVKSALKNDGNNNIAFWIVGHNSADPTYFWLVRDLNPSRYIAKHYVVGDYNNVWINTINSVRAASYVSEDITSSVEVVSPWYLYSASYLDTSLPANFIGEQPAVLLADCNTSSERLKVKDANFSGRPVLSVPVSYAANSLDKYQEYTRNILIYTDTWGY